jgi:hypothetical protein
MFKAVLLFCLVVACSAWAPKGFRLQPKGKIATAIVSASVLFAPAAFAVEGTGPKQVNMKRLQIVGFCCATCSGEETKSMLMLGK